MERCPNCRARVDDADTCRRCGMDLGPLIAVEEAAERLTARGIAHLAAADLAAAVRDLEGAIRLRRDGFTELLVGFTRQLDSTRPRATRSPPWPTR